MSLLVDPAALGGLAGLIALASWAVGRVQGKACAHDTPDGLEERLPLPQAKSKGRTPAGTAREGSTRSLAAGAERLPGGQRAAVLPVPPECRDHILAERRALLASPLALAELHAEASAIRRDERIFACQAESDAPFALTSLAQAARASDRRHAGQVGVPDCPGPGSPAGDLASGCGALQSSLDSFPSLRV